LPPMAEQACTVTTERSNAITIEVTKVRTTTMT
jgi:hypothetical protein